MSSDRATKLSWVLLGFFLSAIVTTVFWFWFDVAFRANWSPVYTFTSPSGDEEVVVQRGYCGLDCSYQVILRSPRGNRMLYDNRSDSYIGSAYAAWSPDGDRIDVLVCDRIAPSALLTYIRSEETIIRKMAPETVGPNLAAALGTTVACAEFKPPTDQ